MRTFWSISVAILKGFVRDRQSAFFAVLFPLMFLVLFGGIFNFSQSDKLSVVIVGDMSLVDEMPDQGRRAFEASFDTTRVDDRDEALEEVRKGDTDAALEVDGQTVVVHYSETDQVKAAIIAGTLRSFVDAANLAVTGQPPTFALQLTGYWWMAVPLLVAATLSFMSLGLLAGALARTAEGAVNLANFFVLPMAFLSGSFFSLDGAPRWLDVVSHLMPLRHLNDALLDVMVRGQGPSSTVVPLAILVGFAAVVGLVAVRLFNWDAD